MDYTLEGQFTPGKMGAWRFDKRSYASQPPPRKLGEPPKGMTNELVRLIFGSRNLWNGTASLMPRGGSGCRSAVYGCGCTAACLSQSSTWNAAGRLPCGGP